MMSPDPSYVAALLPAQYVPTPNAARHETALDALPTASAPRMDGARATDAARTWLAERLDHALTDVATLCDVHAIGVRLGAYGALRCGDPLGQRILDRLMSPYMEEKRWDTAPRLGPVLLATIDVDVPALYQVATLVAGRNDDHIIRAALVHPNATAELYRRVLRFAKKANDAGWGLRAGALWRGLAATPGVHLVSDVVRALGRILPDDPISVAAWCRACPPDRVRARWRRLAAADVDSAALVLTELPPERLALLRPTDLASLLGASSSDTRLAAVRALSACGGTPSTDAMCDAGPPTSRPTVPPTGRGRSSR